MECYVLITVLLEYFCDFIFNLSLSGSPFLFSVTDMFVANQAIQGCPILYIYELFSFDYSFLLTLHILSMRH